MPMTMTSPPPRLILVTGMPRSGTTAVGRMLSLARGTCTLHEPFNYHVGLKEIDCYFEIPGAGTFSRQKLDHCVDRMRALDLSYKPGVFPGEGRWRRAAKRVVGGRAINSYRRCRLTPSLRTIIWKDPCACFTADIVTAAHGAEVVVTLRNPWAVAASFKRLDWGFDLDDISERFQVLGLDCPVRRMPAWSRRDESAINAAILWHLVYATLGRWAEGNEHIRLLDLDEVIEAPDQTYAKLYSLLDLAWDDRVAARIAARYATTSERRMPKEGKPHDMRRDLSTINRYWTDLLDSDEQALVGDVAGQLWQDLRGQCV